MTANGSPRTSQRLAAGPRTVLRSTLKGLACGSLVLGLLLVGPPDSAQDAPDSLARPRDVRDVFAMGYILEDRNEDEVVDYVNARIVLSATPTEADVITAANVAARLGYETSAMNLGLAEWGGSGANRYEGPVILIGNGAGVEAGADPITNADGARLAVEMQETKVRPRLWETWLPDVYINMHGYPTHEWVQYFAGYSAWVRSRNGGQRDWWSPRGWFIPGFNWVDDDESEDITTAQFAILDSVAASITGEPSVDQMNQRLYARYRKYGTQDVENFREYFHNGMLVSLALTGQEVSGDGPTNPRIMYFATTTEAPDETARGEWLQLVATAGLSHSSALLRYLASGVNRIERESSEYEGLVTRSVFRKKPVLPPAADGGLTGSAVRRERGGGTRCTVLVDRFRRHPRL
jgi:hypothetical protein